MLLVLHSFFEPAQPFYYLSTRADQLAWQSSSTITSLWCPPLPSSINAKFDVVIKSNFAVAAAILSDSDGNIIEAAIRRLLIVDAAIGEAHVAILATQLVASCRCSSLIIGGDALIIIPAIKNLFFLVSRYQQS